MAIPRDVGFMPPGGGGFKIPFLGGGGFDPQLPFGGGYQFGPGMPPTGGFPGADSGGGLSGIPGKIGGAISRGVDWLTDPERGANRQALLTGLAGAAASIYGTHRAAREREEMREDEKRREREALERHQSWDPVRAALIGRIIAGRAS